jgi:hypothetical protein
MRKVKRFSSFSLVTICLTINSCSQITNNNPSVLASFEATTPCDEVSRSLLHIPSTDKCAMMKWNLTLLTPTTYELIYAYGMDKAGSRGFSEGAVTKKQSGKWTKGKYKNTEIY